MEYNYNVYNNYYLGNVSCIERRILELEARRDALLSGTCYLGYPVISETYVEEEDNERNSNETEYYN